MITGAIPLLQLCVGARQVGDQCFNQTCDIERMLSENHVLVDLRWNLQTGMAGKHLGTTGYFLLGA